jgi:hypothetical protein
VANGSNFTQNQRQTLFSWWCITAAPLILGNDLTSGNPNDSTVVGAASVNLDFVADSNTITISSNSNETPPDLDSIIVVEQTGLASIRQQSDFPAQKDCAGSWTLCPRKD